MSRFNNPRVLTADGPSVRGAQSLKEPTSPAASTLDRSTQPEPVPATVVVPELQPSGLHRFCFITLCMYLLSVYANEFSYRFFHNKAYISTVTIALLPVLFVLSGGIMQSVQAPFAKWYLAFGAWLAVCAPFSFWKIHTRDVLFDFYFKSFLLYFVICACVLRIREVKRLMFVLGIGTCVIVFSCFEFGHVDGDGRFAVSESVYAFMSNANELALALILGILALLFQVFRKGRWMRVLSFLLILVSLYYALRTASRAGFLAIIATFIALFWLSRHKLKLVILAAVLVPAALFLLPTEARHRLLLIAVAGHNVEASSEAEKSSIASQAQREERLLESLRQTVMHPVFGVGPGDFTAADSHEKELKRERATYLGTHNTYTQVSSESGIPGFVFYLAAIVVCVRMNYRVYKKTSRVKGLEDYAAVSFCMFLSIVAYAVGSFFDQLAYSNYLPIIAGVSSANYLAILRALGGSLDTGALPIRSGTAARL